MTQIQWDTGHVVDCGQNIGGSVSARGWLRHGQVVDHQ